jgi:hypothetical protein|uniref:Uncharacterized protein n=1 Tax=Siphoviridae sp. ctXZQ9 TaxID=2825545 RepID=A0A8S5P1C8_9CAUD|nr:MAG TPA: hypothetical protein [Siphoviridae sp. ctXZQ9]
MAITNQPADDSLFSAYSQIPVETDNLTSGLEIKAQSPDKADMISLNIIDNERSEVLDNSDGADEEWFREFVIPRRMEPGEWYAFRVGSVTANVETPLTVALYQGDAEGHGVVLVAVTDLTIGSPTTWLAQVPPTESVTYDNTVLRIYAGQAGSTSGVEITLTNMSLTYGKNFIGYSPSSVKAANSLTESIDIYRDSGFGPKKKYDLSFLAKAGFRDRPRTFPYTDTRIYFGIDYNLISAYAYRGIGEQDFNVRYASRGVRPRGHNVNFSGSNIGLALTDRTLDNNRNLYVKKYSGYPYFVTLFPKGVSGISPAIQVDVRVKIIGIEEEYQFDISSRLNIPLVYEFEDENADGADYIKLRLSGGGFPNKAWNIIFVDTEVPCNPFYVRWINRKGGWDTYMFEQHKKYTQEVDRGDRYVLANARDPYASETRGELAPEFKNMVQAGADQLDENDFNLLKGVALSPLVQVYNYQIGAWQRVLVDDTDLTWDTKAPRDTVSYEFQLIDEQTQW